MTNQKKRDFWSWLFGIKEKQEESNRPEIFPTPEEPLPPIAAVPSEETTRGLAELPISEETAVPQGVATLARRLAEALLENESLTADLPDDAAQTLLDWGLTLSQHISPESEEIQRNLRRFLRAANRFSQAPTPENLQRLLQHSTAFYPAPLTPEQQTNLLHKVGAFPRQPQQILTQLKTLLEQNQPPTPHKDSPNAPQVL